MQQIQKCFAIYIIHLQHHPSKKNSPAQASPLKCSETPQDNVKFNM